MPADEINGLTEISELCTSMLGLVYLGEMYCLSYSDRAIVVELKQHRNARDFSLCRCALSHDGKGSEM